MPSPEKTTVSTVGQVTQLNGWPDGPRGHGPLGNLPELRRDALAFLRHSRAAYGDVFRLRFGPRDVLVVAEPAAAREVLVTKAGSFRKGRGIQKMEDFLGSGLLTAEGEVWRGHRRLMQPAFHRSALEGMAEEIARATQPLLARLEAAARSGEPVDVASEMLRVALRAVAAVLFGAALDERDLRVVERELPPLLTSTTNRVRSPVDWRLPTPSLWREKAAARALDALVHRIIRERRASGAEGNDLLGMLLSARDEEGRGGLTDHELRDEVMTLFLAGHETTATLLTFLFLALSRHPELRERVQAEARERLGDRSPTAADARNLPLLGACIQETLRLYPPAWLVPRQATGPVTVAGVPLPEGTNVSVNIFLLHRGARYWPEPDAFRPGRWLGRERTPEAFMPFGAGARMCIGNHLALMEAAIIAGLVLREFTLEVPGGGPTGLVAGVTLKPDGPVVAKVRSASPSPVRE
ncbi:cytochrome P450 [Deinococcus aetherius]|uniref:Cytochrome P450 n=1 Tax=Deinococcus aetherius TaxID=200252 RepID=A0ABM8AEI7_9DEIO|nr:cytochrome P450 [Deinococcus aetherius]BDP42052.1 cytochrome P450 [Deinococcus aetherius]